MIKAKSAATAGATIKASAKGQWRLATSTPTVYAPSPKKAMFPKLA